MDTSANDTEVGVTVHTVNKNKIKINTMNEKRVIVVNEVTD